MKFRFHRGGLEESRETLTDVRDLKGLVELISNELIPVTLKDLSIRYYSFDKRIGKHVFIVSSDEGVLGFIEEESDDENVS